MGTGRSVMFDFSKRLGESCPSAEAAASDKSIQRVTITTANEKL